MKSKAGKGLILSISSLLYWILRALDIISKPIYVLDVFMPVSYTHLTLQTNREV